MLLRTERRFTNGFTRLSIQSRLQTGAPLCRHFVRIMKYASQVLLGLSPTWRTGGWKRLFSAIVRAETIPVQGVVLPNGW